jgi:hypothetical protein
MWEPITKAELAAVIARDLAAASEEQRADYARTAITPEKWQQSPWGEQGGGFWAVAVYGTNVLWYNDIEEGFNVSRFVTRGRIPDDEYWCQQDELGWAIPRLVADPGGYRLGPPRPLD